jgi:mono/diheme cytochrome c family protein
MASLISSPFAGCTLPSAEFRVRVNLYLSSSFLDVVMPLFVARITRVSLFVILMIVTAACGSAAAAPTVTPVPAMSAPVQSTMALPMTEIPATPDSPEARGAILFKDYLPEVGFACATCHYATSDKRLIGPGLQGLAARVADYGLTITVDEYIRESIMFPRNFITPDDPAYAPNAMPDKYHDLLTDAQLDDLIAYILSL